MVVGGGTHRENLNPIPIFWATVVTVTSQFTVSDALGSAKLNARLNSSRHGLLRRSVLSIPLALVKFTLSFTIGGVDINRIDKKNNGLFVYRNLDPKNYIRYPRLSKQIQMTNSR